MEHDSKCKLTYTEYSKDYTQYLNVASDLFFCVVAFCFALQYPLKEVVVIHQDPEALRDIQSLQTYILEVSRTPHCSYLIGLVVYSYFI